MLEIPDKAPTSEPAGACACACACACTCERDRHLFCKGGPGHPKRILALDGGGVRGAVSVAFLEEIEAILARRFGKEVLLGHWFDLIGGTSTGSIIGGALAMGFSASDARRFYHELAPKVFVHPIWRIMGLLAKFDARLLRREIHRIVGDLKLGSEDLITGYSLVAKRMDTGSTWILANNRRSQYWEPVGAEVGNKDYDLVSLIRASTAAPLYFDAEEVVIAEPRDGQKGVRGLFVDGGVTPHNNPSLALLLMALLDAYRLHWTPGADNLTIVSIGTGTHRARVVPDEIGLGRTARLAKHAMLSLMNDVHELAMTQMQYLGQTLTPWRINGELGDLSGETPPHDKLFRFIRYDVRLELEWLYAKEKEERRDKIREAFGRDLDETDMIRLRSLDDTTIIPDLYKLARIIAKEQVKEEHWDGDLAHWCGGLRPSAPRRVLPPSPPDRSESSPQYRALKTISEALSHARAKLVHFRARKQEKP
jgi:hypothetical protein